ncbi:MAG: septum formation protein Maf [Alphaproteobacteria bacterium]|nr:septum formation protein Maf [Alphaproteobacteria bacterium]
MNKPLILASASPTRRRLLAAAGIEFAQQAAGLNEKLIKQEFRSGGQGAADCALALADAKARAVAVRWPDALVIGADQILHCAGKWFDKPAEIEEVRTQLQSLRGLTHELVTAACVVEDRARVWHTLSSAQLSMRRFSDAFLDLYLMAEGPAVLGSVGAYRLEGRGIQLFDEIRGDYFAILGLPLLELAQFLRSRQVLGS